MKTPHPKVIFKNEKIRLDSIFHPSDFSPDDEPSLIHALKIALSAKARLRLFHVKKTFDRQKFKFMHLRPILEKWQEFEVHNPKYKAPSGSVAIEKIGTHGSNPVQTIVRHLAHKPASLVVLATHQRNGPARWFHRAIAEPIARKTNSMTLFVPRRTSGFVDSATGKVKLRHILIPLDHSPHPQPAFEAACALASALNANDVAITFLHVGDAYDYPSVHLPKDCEYSVELLVREGKVIDQILKTAHAISADLIAMTTRGHDGFLDALRGSTTEQIVRKARCPTLMVSAQESNSLIRMEIED